MANTSLADFIKRIQNSRDTAFSTAAGAIANAKPDFSDPMMTSAALSSRDTQQQLINTNNAMNATQKRFAGILAGLGAQSRKTFADTFTKPPKRPRDTKYYDQHVPKRLEEMEGFQRVPTTARELKQKLIERGKPTSTETTPSAGTAAITVPGSNDPGVELQSYNPNTYKTGTLLNIGSTGRTTGPHLHFELYDPQGKPVDPASWLAKGLVFTDDGKIFGTSDRMNSPFGNRVIHPVTGERNVMHYGSDYGGEPNQPIYVVGDMTKAYTTDGGGHTAEFSNLSRGRFPQLQGYTGRALHLNTLPMVPGTI